WHEALQGSALAFLVILIFLRSLTSTLIISIAIPLSILLSFIVMYFLDQTLNVFTLGGLALAVGRLVDDSIVELENINRHLNIPGTSRRRAVLDAAREVAMPILSATVTTIIVFLPTVFLEGQIKLLFIPLTFTISVSLFASFLVSRTVTPLLALRVLWPEKPVDPRSRRLRDRVFRLSQRFFEGTDELYQRLIEWALGHRGLVVGSIAVTFVASLLLVAAPWLGMRPLIGTEFFPPSDEAQFRVDLKAPIGTRVEATERTGRGMENIVRATLEVEVLGYELAAAEALAGEIARILHSTEGVTDVTVSRDANYPQVEIVVDREKAASVKLSQRTISETVLFSLNSNASINPSIFTDPRTGNQY